MSDLFCLTYLRTIPSQSSPVRVTKYFFDLAQAGLARDRANWHVDTIGNVSLTRWKFVESILEGDDV